MTGYQRGPKDRFVTNQQQTGQLHVGGGGGGGNGGGGGKTSGCLWLPLAAAGAVFVSRAKGWA